MGAILDLGQAGTLRGPQQTPCLPFSQAFLQVLGVESRSLMGTMPTPGVLHLFPLVLCHHSPGERWRSRKDLLSSSLHGTYGRSGNSFKPESVS